MKAARFAAEAVVQDELWRAQSEAKLSAAKEAEAARRRESIAIAEPPKPKDRRQSHAVGFGAGAARPAIGKP